MRVYRKHPTVNVRWICEDGEEGASERFELLERAGFVWYSALDFPDVDYRKSLESSDAID